MSRAGALKALKIAGGVLALGLLAVAVRSAVEEIRALPVAFRLGRAGAATLLLAGTYFGLVAVWRTLLADLGARLSYADTLQLWSFSNLGRYLPGKVWQVLGLVVLARGFGVAPARSAAAAILALGFMISTGALTGVLLVPGALPGLGPSGGATGVLAGLLLVPVLWPRLLGGVLRRLPGSWGCSDVPPMSRGTVLRLVIFFLAGWLAHGISFLVFSSSFGPVAWRDLPLCTGAYSLAHVVGLLAVFAPGGLGVREGLLGHLLGAGGAGPVPGYVVAVAARLWTIAGELLVLAAAVAVRAASSRARS